MRRLVTILILLGAGAGSSSAAAADQPPRVVTPRASAASLKALASRTRVLINAERRAKGLRALRACTALAEGSRDFSRQMVRKQFFDHDVPGGPSYRHRIAKSPYLEGGWRRAGVSENLAMGFAEQATPEQIVAAWMASPEHREAILDAKSRDIGVGVAPGTDSETPTKGLTYTAEFGYRSR